jgi:hypothetical protein
MRSPANLHGFNEVDLRSEIVVSAEIRCLRGD